MIHRTPLASAFLLSVFVWGCASTPRQTPPSRVAASPVGLPSAFPSSGARRVRALRLDFPIEFSLPDKSAWSIRDGATWLTVEHASSASQLALRTWRAERLVRREECVAQARSSGHPLPLIHEEALIERRPIAAPQGFDTELLVGVEADGAALSGYALAIGASVGRCYAAVFTTRVHGPDADQELAARLGVAVDQIFGSVRFVGVDERAVRRRPMLTPASQ